MVDQLAFWGRMSTSKKVSLMVGIAVILAVSFFAFRWLTEEPYKVLFTDLEARDASSVVSELEQRKIDYRFANNGADILIPESLVHEVRIKLMGSNMPLVGGVGFEVFDNADFGMTEFVQKINYQRALEGELTRTIMALGEVRYARVHLVLPEEGLFQQKDSPAQASVTLFTHNNEALGPRKVLGMQRLVSASVPGLSASDVTITDQEGRVLSQEEKGHSAVLAVSDRLQQKRAVETYLAEKASKVLASTFGADGAMVSVDAQLDFSQVSTSSESILPVGADGSGAVVRRKESRSGGQGKKSEGNLTSEVEYQLGTKRETRTELPGKISRLSVGVIVPAGISDERRLDIQKVVEMAVGFDVDRGDAIAVSSQKPDGIGSPAVEPATSPMPLHGNETSGSKIAAESSQVESGKAAGIARLSTWVASNPLYFVAGFLVILVVSVALTSLLRRQPKAISEPARLSEAERAQLLIEIQDWMGRESPRTGEAG